MTVQFDTLKALKALKAAGFEEAQAEAVVETVGGAINENVASKADVQGSEGRLLTDIAALRTELKTEIAELRTEVKTEVSGLKADIFKHLWIMGFGIIGATVALLKIIP